MSNYNLTARNKETGEVVTVEAVDDYFGKHEYGYAVPAPWNHETVYNQNDFHEKFEVVEQPPNTMSIEQALQDIQDVYFNAGALVSVDTYDRTHNILTEAIDQARKEERKKVVEWAEHTDTHVCRFNDGEQTCDCYNEALDNIIAHLTK